jgi:regulator of CtrA degradation
MILKNHANFMDASMDKAKKLMQAIHHYIKWKAPLEVEHMSQENRFKVSCEAMRVAVRVTEVMGWLMLQKAILAGEISREELLSEKCHFLKEENCLDHSSEADLELPRRLRELLKESRELYARIMRLEHTSQSDLPAQEELKKSSLKGGASLQVCQSLHPKS